MHTTIMRDLRHFLSRGFCLLNGEWLQKENGGVSAGPDFIHKHLGYTEHTKLVSVPSRMENLSSAQQAQAMGTSLEMF